MYTFPQDFAFWKKRLHILIWKESEYIISDFFSFQLKHFLQSGLKLFSDGTVYVLLLFPLCKKKKDGMSWWILFHLFVLICFYFLYLVPCVWTWKVPSLFFFLFCGEWKSGNYISQNLLLIEVSCRICQGDSVLWDLDNSDEIEATVASLSLSGRWHCKWLMPGFPVALENSPMIHLL